MKKEITNDILLEKMGQQFEKIDTRFQKMDDRFEKMDKRFEKMDERFDELIIMSKMSFDDLGNKVENNTHPITQLKETVGQTNDHLCRVEQTMVQEFAATHLQRNRLTTQVGHHSKRIKKLERGHL